MINMNLIVTLQLLFRKINNRINHKMMKKAHFQLLMTLIFQINQEKKAMKNQKVQITPFIKYRIVKKEVKYFQTK